MKSERLQSIVIFGIGALLFAFIIISVIISVARTFSGFGAPDGGRGHRAQGFTVEQERAANPYNQFDAAKPLVPTSKVIPGLKATDFRKFMIDGGFSLETNGKFQELSWKCSKEFRDGKLLVEANETDEDEVHSIRAGIMDFHSLETIERAPNFFGLIGTIPYLGSDPDASKQWIVAHLAEDSSTVIGGVKFELKNLPAVRMLIVTPEHE